MRQLEGDVEEGLDLQFLHRCQSGDTIILRSARPITAAEFDQMRQNLEAVIGDREIKFILVDNSFDIPAIIRQGMLLLLEPS